MQKGLELHNIHGCSHYQLRETIDKWKFLVFELIYTTVKKLHYKTKFNYLYSKMYE